MRRLIFAIATIATLAFAAPVYADPNCSGCVVAEGSVGCGGCVIADGGGNGGNVTGFVAGPICTAEDNKGHCVESASYQCAPYSEACRLPRKPRVGKIADRAP
jgi:hypothetical protein